ncbi:MAG: DUF5329 domain-containing protein [Candidatus Omnitrophica bacterium]|nr:DUF5329 domain-containing protein [Candidatus Omnitrophota bacterium]
MKIFFKTIAMMLFCLFIPMNFLQAEDMTLNVEINFLMRQIETSPCLFYRNKKEYDGARALEHIFLKYKHYKDKIVTAEDFIERCVTKSLISGKDYSLQCADQPPMPLAEWLHLQLNAYRMAEQE